MNQPSEHDLHAYVDGRLDGERRAAVGLYLARHPERAAELQAWQRDAQHLRASLAGGPALPDNPALDPAAIRRRRHQRTVARLALAASLVLCLGLGGLGGWQVRGWRAAALPMGDALTAYRLLALEPGTRPDLVPQRDGDLQGWLDRHFQRRVAMPDLRAADFRPVGGRLFATEQGAAAMVLYRDAAGHAISFYVRPPGPRRHLLPRGERIDGGLLAQYGSGNGYNYAMVSRADDADAQVAARALQPLI
ncbi:anti-sigma factor family protein [Frateuria hangzhouensis]|uniref:anti-sigma factor family protein n=1 Tax=Frateuria hangzhouensis TaxID=2995589 RepID=UPI002260C507|nr:anti-sigma factor [Frateuria sp. STR12]MCX7513252.1 anti-sigma factor [Frateuria sp. STR12]